MSWTKTKRVTLLAGLIAPLILAGACTNPPGSFPFDLYAAKTDFNGFPLNPRWYPQSLTPPTLPDPKACPAQEPWNTGCTHQAAQIWENTSSFKWPQQGAGHIDGHVNWSAGGFDKFTPSTFTGTIFWGSHSRPGTDDDENIELVPGPIPGGKPDSSGLTAANPTSLTMEFDSDETMDQFPDLMVEQPA